MSDLIDTNVLSELRRRNLNIHVVRWIADGWQGNGERQRHKGRLFS
ncbi:MAG TPA: hypothetical protein VFP68_12165 [Burkholderiaceae bacterium]|nr:hypothetical protein [Burkholderiaceae bacterium]